jgi:hypothetical protein
MTKSITMLFAAAVTCLAASGVKAQTTFPLVCRGGGSKLFLSHLPVSGLPLAEVRLVFEKAPTGGSANLQPGQCAWQDRPVAASEPLTICRTSFQVRASFALLRDRQPQVSRPRLSDGTLDPLGRMVGPDGDQIFTFMVFNDFAGCLRTN